MHVPSGHSFPVATGVAFALGLGPPSLLSTIFRAQARKALLISLGFFLFFLVLFIDYPGIFGGA